MLSISIKSVIFNKKGLGMKKIFAFITFFLSFNANASDVFVLTGIPVSATGENVIKAQENAVEIGKKEAFNQLISKIVHSETPAVFDETLDISSLVQDVSLSNEKIFAQNYKGDLTVRFKAEPIRQLLTEKGVQFLNTLPEPMLLVPVFEDETKTLVFHQDNPIYTYWLSEKPTFDLFQIKMIENTPIKLNEAQKAWEQGSFEAYKKILNDNGLTSILILHIKKTGDFYTVKTSVLPDNTATEAHISLSLTDDRPDIKKVVKDLVFDAFRNMKKKWLYLSTKTSNAIEVFHLVTPVSKVSDLKRIKDKINQLSFAEQIEIKGFKNKLLSIDISFRGSADELAQKLKLHQMLIENYGLTENEQPLFLLTEVLEHLSKPSNINADDTLSNTENSYQNNLNEIPEQSTELDPNNREENVL